MYVLFLFTSVHVRTPCLCVYLFSSSLVCLLVCLCMFMCAFTCDCVCVEKGGGVCKDKICFQKLMKRQYFWDRLILIFTSLSIYVHPYTTPEKKTGKKWSIVAPKSSLLCFSSIQNFTQNLSFLKTFVYSR